jgi:hypothetical protein
MKKFLLISGVLLLALAVGAYLVLARNLDAFVVNGVNTYGPKLTQTKVELAGASLSPFSGSGTLTGLSVGNPKGWSDGRAFYLGKVHLDIVPQSVMGDPIVINEILIDQPEFNYETRILSSNIKDLLKNIEGFTGGGGGGQEPAAQDGKPRKFIVKKFRFTNGKARVELAANVLTVMLPPISLDNLGVAEGGITADQLSGVLLKQVLASVVEGSASALKSGDLSVDKLKDAARNAGDTLKKMFERK